MVDSLQADEMLGGLGAATVAQLIENSPIVSLWTAVDCPGYREEIASESEA